MPRDHKQPASCGHHFSTLSSLESPTCTHPDDVVIEVVAITPLDSILRVEWVICACTNMQCMCSVCAPALVRS